MISFMNTSHLIFVTANKAEIQETWVHFLVAVLPEDGVGDEG